MHDQSTIYFLEDPRDYLVRYVGMTRQPLVVRLADHVARAHRGSTTPCAYWIRALIAQELLPHIGEIDRCAPTHARAAEAYWIGWYFFRAAPLLNKASWRTHPTAPLRPPLDDGILALLADHAWHTGTEIAARLGVTLNQLRRALERLRQTPLVVGERCDGRNGPRGIYRYCLAPAPAEKAPPLWPGGHSPGVADIWRKKHA